MSSVIGPQGNENQWIAQWRSIQPLSEKWLTAGAVHQCASHTFIVITDGQATWKINGENIHVVFGQLIAIEGKSYIEVLEGGNLDLAGWQIEFQTYCLADAEGQIAVYEWQVPAGNSFQAVKLTGGFLTSIGDSLNLERQNGPGFMVEQQHLLYGLLKSLYSASTSKEQSTEEGMQRSIAYIQEHYHEPITRAQLAQIAGISQWHYSRIFSERWGRPPLDFLAHYRIYRAQEELLFTPASSQEIAKKVGFEDMHYFSRRFKQLSGVSPRNYAKSLPQRRLLSTSALCAEVLIELGMIPHAVMITPLLLPAYQREIFEKYEVKMLEAPQYFTDIELIQQEKPTSSSGIILQKMLRRDFAQSHLSLQV